jgi:dipeptidyl-peptidase III
LFDKYTGISDEMLAWRDTVIANKEPRAVFVQANTILDENNEVRLTQYEPTPEGLIQSFLERFPAQ